MNLHLGDLVMFNKTIGRGSLMLGMIVKLNSSIIHIEWVGGQRNLQYFVKEADDFRKFYLEYRQKMNL